ncbi:uncharacterized protein [Drosophila takahashii]|uniref:uncharacterized protein n=1 Tax=Drosophila takahashii TaxID=29030 RepID=UPI0038994BA4
MCHHKFLWISLSLFFLMRNAEAICYINKADLSSNYVFFSIENGVYDILHSDSVATNHAMYLLCDDGTSPIKLVCQPNNRFNVPFPSAGCTKVFKPTVEEILDNSCPHTMYRVGYKYSNRFMEVYRSCYDSVNYAAQFSINKVYPSRESAPRQDKAFTADRAMTARDAAAYSLSRIYQRFNSVLGPNQNYVSSNPPNPFDHGHLTPSGDYSFDQFQKATNKLRNVVPQYSNINNGNWKRVEFWVKRLLVRQNYDVLKVCTGALGVQKLANQNRVPTPMYLLANNRIPIPEWMYKIVSHISGQQWVVITHNDGITSRRPDPNTICQVIPCDPDLNPSGVGSTFCCNPFNFIRQNVPHLTGVC